MKSKKPVFPEHKPKSAKTSKAKLKKLMHEQFQVAEAELMIVVDAITQAVMMKFTDQALKGKRGKLVDPDEVIIEVTTKLKSLEAVVMSNYFAGGDNEGKESKDGSNSSDVDEGATEDKGEDTSKSDS